MKNIPLPNLRKPLTKKGHAKLADEHANLVQIERPKLLDNIARAAAEGDRSENAEYIYSKKKLREMDYRIRYLNKILKDAQVIDPTILKSDSITFASTVVVEDEEKNQKTWTLVGEGETDHNLGFISWKSVVGKALLGKKVGDIVVVSVPRGETELEIIQIFYA